MIWSAWKKTSEYSRSISSNMYAQLPRVGEGSSTWATAGEGAPPPMAGQTRPGEGERDCATAKRRMPYRRTSCFLTHLSKAAVCSTMYLCSPSALDPYFSM